MCLLPECNLYNSGCSASTSPTAFALHQPGFLRQASEQIGEV
jgi:hypothetical protein